MLRWINGTSEFKGSEGSECSGSGDVISDDEDFVEGSGDVDDEDFNQELGSGSGEENLQQPQTIPEITIPTKDKSFINLLSREQEKIRKKNWKKNVTTISPKIVPEIVQKSSQKSSKNPSQNPPQNLPKNCKRLSLDSLGGCLKKCKKYKKLSDWELCMVGCRNYGVTKKTSSYLSPCTAKSNSMHCNKISPKSRSS